MLESELATGVVLDGRYELLTPIARGGMGRVWVARAKGGRGFKRLLAVKTVLSSDYEDPRMGEMLLQEAKIASMVHHPNVVTMEDFGEHKGICYLAMELVRGETLQSVFKAALASDEGGLPVRVAVNLVGQVCKGLQAAHDLTGEDGSPLGLVHRDVTPGNVIVTYKGVAKLLDFGIAKTADGAALTRAGEMKGKISYLAPEVLQQKPIDRRVDVFSVGVMLYMATTGCHPFRGGAGSQDGVLARILSDRPPPSPAGLTKSYPEGLDRVVMKALEKDREKRHQSADELLRDLEEVMPEAFAPGIEREVQECLNVLFSDRISETTAQIRAAEAMAGQTEATAGQAPPDVSKIRIASEEAGKTETRPLVWVLGTMLAVTAAIAVTAREHKEKEVVEKIVYLPGEVRTVEVAAVAASAESVEKKPAEVKAAKKVRTEKKEEPRGGESVRSKDEETGEAESKGGEERRLPFTEQQEATPVRVPSPAPAPAPALRPPGGPKNLTSSEGNRRLTVDPSVPPYRPSIPKAIENMGPFNANVKMCVDRNGVPSSATVVSENPSLAPAFRSAMMRWRYTPLRERAETVGFCYAFRYEVR